MLCTHLRSTSSLSKTTLDYSRVGHLPTTTTATTAATCITSQGQCRALTDAATAVGKQTTSLAADRKFGKQTSTYCAVRSPRPRAYTHVIQICGAVPNTFQHRVAGVIFILFFFARDGPLLARIGKFSLLAEKRFWDGSNARYVTHSRLART